MSRLRKCLARRGPQRGASRDGLRLVAALLVALLVVVARASAEASRDAPLPSTGEAHGAASDETRADHDGDQSEAAPTEKSGTSAPKGQAKKSEPRQRDLLPFIILKSIERPFMMPK
jgi:hypothetical protein